MPNLARIVRFVILLPYYLEVYTVFDICMAITSHRIGRRKINC